MIRLSRALKLNTAYASFALIGLVACGDDDPAETPIQQTPVPVPDAGGGTGGGGGEAGQGGASAGDPGETAFAEDSGEDCVVPDLPSFEDLTEEATLPDPFLALNGERLTRK